MKCSKKETGEVFAAKFVTCARREDRLSNSIKIFAGGEIKILIIICLQEECGARGGHHELSQESQNSPALRGL